MVKKLTSDEGIKLYAEVGLSENTFYRHAREGKIKHTLPEGRERGAKYDAEDIQKIVDRQRAKRKMRIASVKDKDENESKTDWVQEKDLPYLLALDYEMYGIEETVDISITHTWWEKNPNMCRIVFNANDRKDVWGYLTIIPMEEDTIISLLQRKMHERDIRAKNILSYEEGKEYHCYAASIVTRAERRRYVRTLINNMLTFWCEQYPAIKITKVYAYADSSEGWNMIKHLFFAPRYDIGDKAFELDPNKPNPSKIVQTFQDCLTEKHSGSKSYPDGFFGIETLS